MAARKKTKRSPKANQSSLVFFVVLFAMLAIIYFLINNTLNPTDEYYMAPGSSSSEYQLNSTVGQ
jgi:hypothetical protein